jgi:hypothetical protein
MASDAATTTNAATATPIRRLAEITIEVSRDPNDGMLIVLPPGNFSGFKAT